MVVDKEKLWHAEGMLSPEDILWSLDKRPLKVVEFDNPEAARELKKQLLKKSHVALFGSREVKGKRVFIVEDYGKRLKEIF